MCQEIASTVEREDEHVFLSMDFGRYLCRFNERSLALILYIYLLIQASRTDRQNGTCAITSDHFIRCCTPPDGSEVDVGDYADDPGERVILYKKKVTRALHWLAKARFIRILERPKGRYDRRWRVQIVGFKDNVARFEHLEAPAGGSPVSR